LNQLIPVFQYTISLTDVLFLLIAVGGIYLTLQQIRQGYEIQKATFFKELYLTFFDDSEIRQAFYLIDYNQLLYNEDGKGFENSPHEKPIDRLLNFVNLLCELYERKLLTKKEMRFFQYEMIRIWRNSTIQTYLEYLAENAQSIGDDKPPFESFVRYCKRDLPIRVELISNEKL
jgi:hypothetical protein